MTERYRRVVDLVDLTQILQSSLAGISADEIAQRFEVSRRTADRMLSALRDRFPNIRAEVRDNHKYWRLRGPVGSSILKFPKEISDLSDQLLAQDVGADNANAREQHIELVNSVLGTSPVGVFLLDRDFSRNGTICHRL
jgi:predicted DNA-binding transcriptional regulator YafY